MYIDIVDKVLDIFGKGDEHKSTFNNIKEEESSNNIKNASYGQLADTNLNSSVIIVKPLKFEDITVVCNALKQRDIIVMDLKSLEPKTSQRCVDFAGGASLALNGNIEEISAGIILLSPNEIEMSSNLKEKLSIQGIF